ncbi:MAG: SAM hydrolase/SAM-dependent halogenase family protein [Promethearchaeota archaeon]|jgi:S-adenosylmethionine hydrolase
MARLHKKIIGLITDFGTKGQHYVASMKGIILGINPEVNIVDISHNITPFSIIEASYILKAVYEYYPKGTVFIIVVDPGVGSSREILAVNTASGYNFVGPNNGFFQGVLESDEISECIDISNADYFVKPTSNTFHGRDIMAPIAAHISKGVPLSNFGLKFDRSKIISYPIEFRKISNKEVRCTVQYVDNFGNIVTNFKPTSIPFNDGDTLKATLGPTKVKGIFVSFFEKASKNSIVFLVGSTGFLEISKNQGNAAVDLGVSVGDLITVTLPEVN